MTCVPCRDRHQAAERQQYAERRAGLRQPVALPPLRRDRRGQPVARTQERPEPKALRRTPGPRAVHGVRRAFPGRRKVRSLSRTLVSPVRLFPGHPDLGPELHRDRYRYGSGARPVRQRSRRGALPRLREALTGSGRGGQRYLAHIAVYVVDMIASTLRFIACPYVLPSRRPPAYVSPSGGRHAAIEHGEIA